jgi:hypothetical protein
MLTAPLLACCLLAQALPSGPIEMAGGTVSVGGEVSVTAGSRDDIAFFNFTDYEHNALRLFRVSLSGTWQPNDRLAVVTEIRSEDLKHVIPYALYVRARPWKDRKIDIQAGRIPPVFGAFARRSYGATDNPLIGYPLAYQYLLALRPDAIPASADDLLFMRARGWRANYPVGVLTPGPGVPIISAYRWDTGVEAHATAGMFDISAAVTTGTLSDPTYGDRGRRPQLSGRVAAKPITGLVIGASASRGQFLTESLAEEYTSTSNGHSFNQDALGLDAEYSRGYWIVRGEAIHSRWTLPLIGTPTIGGPLTADAAFVESSYRISPRVFAAARLDHMTFSKVTGVRFFPGVPTPWDSPVTRVEAGGGVYLQRNVTLRATVQGNWRDAGRVLHRAYVSGQLSYWF